MNLEYLKFAIEVAKTKSINKAAENLYISQPNLSRAIKKLEDEAGITIFNRTTRGIEVTIAGDEFLSRAEIVLSEVGKMENISNPNKDEQKFSISVPKAAYISKAFMSFVAKLDLGKTLSIDYKESSAIGAIENILLHGFNLGIIRYEKDFEPYFQVILREEGLVEKKVCQFTFYIAFSANDKLAHQEEITIEDLKDHIELTHGDSYIPYVNTKVLSNNELEFDKKIRIYDSMGQLSMLKNIPNTFMLVYPLDEDTLNKYCLVQRKVDGLSKTCFDSIIYKKNYHFSYLDKFFVEELEKEKI